MSSTLVALGLPAVASPGLCLLVDPSLVWLHVISDVAIGLAYLSIPAALVLLLLRRRDLAYPWIIALFAAFIVACGTTHLMHAWAVFRPAPELEGVVKAVTAAISVTVAVVLWPVLPKLLALRSPAALAREVEERRAAEQRARESEARALDSEARIAAFIANLAEALLVVRAGPDGGLLIETVNPAFERMFGTPAEALVGREAAEALPEPLRRMALPRWRQAVARGEIGEYELTAELPGGRLTWQTVLVPLRAADGRVERLLGSARDVTATRRLQAGLVQSARLATVGTMCAGLAHEASQPLNAAALWLRRARQGAEALPDAQQAPLAHAIAVVQDQLRRAGELVTRIRALAGGDGEEAGRFDAIAPVQAAQRIAATQYAAEGITLSLQPAGEALPVRGSPARLEQAVLHLLANARDAVAERRLKEPEAAARIDMALRREGGRVILEVRDTGTGLKDGLGEAIFDPFFTTKEPGRGIGLGLPFAAGVARGMGGGMDAWTLPDGGACFRMELAAADVDAVPGAVAAA
jgi:PAS domain S-box-containing protein